MKLQPLDTKSKTKSGIILDKLIFMKVLLNTSNQDLGQSIHNGSPYDKLLYDDGHLFHRYECTFVKRKIKIKKAFTKLFSTLTIIIKMLLYFM